MYFKHCLLIKVPSASADAQTWMSSLAARTRARRSWSDHNQLLETHLENRTVSSLPRGGKKAEAAASPFLSDHAPSFIRRSHIMQWLSTVNSLDNRALYNDIHTTCLAIKEARKEGKPTVGIHSYNLRDQPLWKFRQCLHTTGFNQPGSPLTITVYIAQCHLHPELHWHLQSLSGPGSAPVGRLSTASIARAAEVPGAPHSSLSRVGLEGQLCNIKNYSILTLITSKGRGLAELWMQDTATTKAQKAKLSLIYSLWHSKPICMTDRTSAMQALSITQGW